MQLYLQSFDRQASVVKKFLLKFYLNPIIKKFHPNHMPIAEVSTAFFANAAMLQFSLLLQPCFIIIFCVFKLNFASSYVFNFL